MTGGASRGVAGQASGTLRGDAEGRQPLIVVPTSHRYPEFERECRRRGADFFFDKAREFGAVKRLLDEFPARAA